MSRRNAVYAKHHQERFGVEKRGKNVSGEKDFAGIAPFDVLRRSQEAQTELYQTGDLGLMNEFFAAGGCFLQKVQRQMTIDDNLPVLELFLRYWEFIPTERSYMIKNASLPFIECYLQNAVWESRGRNLPATAVSAGNSSPVTHISSMTRPKTSAAVSAR